MRGNMARIRTIKPQFWNDGDLAQVSRDARLLMVGLISFADDEGRFVASPAAIIGYAYPHDNITPSQVRRWLTELEKHGTVILYGVDGLAYGYLPNFRKHKRISHP